jgi:hypothetical protein
MVDEAGGLKRMAPSAPANEDQMQTLVARYPELITDGDGDLLLIRREQAIADSEAGGGRWSLDHLFITSQGVPVLVELKRAVDTRLRREVVGQMLDYAANATVYWQGGRIAETFARTATAMGQEPDQLLSAFIGDADPEEFWRQVDSNMKAGRIKLVFVADSIPRELARIVEFLNDQMRADVRAVELRWFSDDAGTTTLSPRIIGETERTAATKAAANGLAPIDRASWIAQHLAPFGAETVQAAETFIDIVESAGGQAEVASTQGSIYAAFPGEDGKLLYPFNLWRQKTGGQLSLSLGYLKPRPAFANEALRQGLYDKAVIALGPLSTRTLNGYPGAPITRLNDPNIAAKFRDLVSEVLAIGGRPNDNAAGVSGSTHLADDDAASLPENAAN